MLETAKLWRPDLKAFEGLTLSEPATDALLDQRAGGELAYRLVAGVGVDANPRRGLSLYRRLARQGCPVAAYNLSVCYMLGVGVPRSLAWSVHWARECERILDRRRV